MQPIICRQWHLRNDLPTPGELSSFADRLGVSPLIARLLWLRGLTDETSATGFLQSKLADLPDPFLLPGMAPAVQRLEQAIRNNEMIAVHGDFDVDGISGTALLVDALRAMGARVDFHIPLRLKDGYGLSAEALEKASAQGVTVVVSVDCGISAVAEGALAERLGLDLIITDHHQPAADLPPAVARINPHLPDSPAVFQDLAGVGVAFFLLVGLRKGLRDSGWFSGRAEPDLRQVLDLVALGTVADLVPLRGLNRILVRSGLQLLEQSRRPGIVALKRVAKVDQVNAGSVGFRLAPRLNAAGRLEDAAFGVELLLTEDNQRAFQLAQALDGFNRERQGIEQQTLQEALAKIAAWPDEEQRTIVLADDNWHPGVIGIVASRLVERFHRPAVLIALENGKGKGSARSIRGFHLYNALQACQDSLAGFGGHEFAAGLTIETQKLEEFCSRFETHASATLDEEALCPRLAHDGEIDLAELNLDAVLQLEQLGPYGIANPEALLVARDVFFEQSQVVGEEHVRCTVRQGQTRVPCIAFGQAGRLRELRGSGDVLFTPVVNRWRDRVNVQLRIKDFRTSAG